MYRAEVLALRRAALGEKGCKRPAVISTVHSSRVRARKIARPSQRPRSMDRLVLVSKAIDRKIREEGRFGAPVSLIYNGVELQRYNHQQPCCTFHDEYGIPDGAPIVASGRAWSPKRSPTSSMLARRARAVPNAWLL